jgi:hypothetical protein
MATYDVVGRRYRPISLELPLGSEIVIFAAALLVALQRPVLGLAIGAAGAGVSLSGSA